MRQNPADLLRMLQGCSSSWYSSSTTINLVSGSRGLNTGLTTTCLYDLFSD